MASGRLGAAVQDAIDLEAAALAGHRPDACAPAPAAWRAGAVRLGPGVWRVDRAGAPRLVAKRHLFRFLTKGAPHDLLVVEVLVLQRLLRAGCPVAAIVAVDLVQGLAFYEYVDGPTVDAYAQAQPDGDQAGVGVRLVRGGHGIDRALADDRRLARRVAPGGGVDQLQDGWRQAAAGAAAGLDWLFGCQPAARRAGGRALDRIVAACAARPARLGSADYNARNVVLDGRLQPHFIEFATLSWDWPERRLVQYATALGAGRPDGRFVSLLDSDARGAHGACGGDPAALDQHQVVFLLNGVGRLAAAWRSRHSAASQGLLQAWARPQARLAQLAGLLGEPWDADPDAGTLRRLTRKRGGPAPST
jgi:hypothetical protein